MRWIILVLIILAVCGGEQYARALHNPGEIDRKVQEIEERLRKLEERTSALQTQIYDVQSRIR